MRRRVAIRGVAVGLALLVAACVAPQGGNQTVPAVRSAPALPPPSTDDLLGGQAGTVRAKLGAPDFVRSEPGAEIWRYAGRSCQLFVFFYETADRSLTAAHIDARASNGGTANVAACLGEVATSRS